MQFRNRRFRSIRRLIRRFEGIPLVGFPCDRPLGAIWRGRFGLHSGLLDVTVLSDTVGGTLRYFYRCGNLFSFFQLYFVRVVVFRQFGATLCRIGSY